MRSGTQGFILSSFVFSVLLFSNTALEKVGKRSLKSRREGGGLERMLKPSSAPGTSNFYTHSCPCCPLPCLPNSVRALLLTPSSSAVINGAADGLVCKCVFCVCVRLEDAWAKCSPHSLCSRPGIVWESAAAAAVLGSSVMLKAF